MRNEDTVVIYARVPSSLAEAMQEFKSKRGILKQYQVIEGVKMFHDAHKK